MRARDIMTTPTFALSPSATLDEATATMTGHGFTTMPVVDADGRLLGLLSEEDILRVPPPPGDPDTGVLLAGHRTAAAVMRTSGFVATADTEVRELARQMSGAGVRSAPVVEGRHVVGMVTFQDVLRATGGHRPPLPGSLVSSPGRPGGSAPPRPGGGP
ncbi:CBS domain-containing protein [Amycolatopsis sp. NEAU-NG30]|uniref:CBS domain-containing protein n=1 Tax=Amycolatopsis melonis TaxID=3156488 RepID=A0ABV0L6S8_9PSEU